MWFSTNPVPVTLSFKPPWQDWECLSAGAVSFQGTHISELVSVNWEKPVLPGESRGDHSPSVRVVVEKTMFAVCYYGQCPPPSRWQNVNAMEHFESAALSTEACQEALQESVWLPSTIKPPPSTASAASLSFPFICSPAACHLLISPVGCNVISSPNTHRYTQLANTSSGPICWTYSCSCSRLSLLYDHLFFDCQASCGFSK